MELFCRGHIEIRLYRRFLASIVIGFGILHGISTLVERGKIHPFTYLGWMNEQLSLSFILIVVGVSLMCNARAISPNWRSQFAALLSVLSLAVVSMAIFLRYFWLSAAVFILLGLLDAIFILRALTRIHTLLRTIIVAACTGIFMIVLCFICASFYWVGN